MLFCCGVKKITNVDHINKKNEVHMKVFKILYVDGTIKQIEKEPTLDEMQKIVSGYIERVIMGKNSLWVNEDGQSKRLKINVLASEILNRIIVGNAILELNNQ